MEFAWVHQVSPPSLENHASLRSTLRVIFFLSDMFVAVTSADSGRAWLQAFKNYCAGRCHVDFLPLHYYGDDIWTYPWSFGQYLYSVSALLPGLKGNELG
jgi:hypothetical protein